MIKSLLILLIASVCHAAPIFNSTRNIQSVIGSAPIQSSGGQNPVISCIAATGSVAGCLSATDWTTFNSKQSALSFSAPLVNTTGTISCNVASGSQAGCLSSTDWSTFNGKQAALTIGNLTDAGTDGITVTGGTGSVIGSGTSISQHVSDSTHAGYLSSTDWGTFNGKQAAGNYITALTGDVTATGPGSVAATVAKIQGTTVSGTTGTVNVVFSASPTLTSPALGTPTALVGTNITGTASGLTAGNVTTNANLTGPITSVGNATSIASQTGTGTKFVVDTSPTIVTPTISTSATVPLVIGGTGASSTLTIESTSGTGTTDAIIFKTGSQSEAMRIKTNGRVGIGTTAPDDIFNVYGTTGNQMTITNSTAGGREWSLGEELTPGKFNIYDSAVGARLTIDSSGNVGIGTTSPSTLLQTVSAAAALTGINNKNTSSTGIGMIQILNDVSDQTTLMDYGSAVAGNILGVAKAHLTELRGDGSGGIYIDTGASGGKIYLGTGAAPALTVTGAGNVGIGTTTANSKLEVDGDMRLTSGSGSSIYFADGTSMSTAAIIGGSASSESTNGDAIITADADANGSGDVILKTGSNDRLHILNGGNVGIGTATPGAALDVNGQIIVESMTQTSAAQSGTVCYNSGTGAITYDASLGCLTSSRRFKKNIKPINAGLAEVIELKPVSFYRKLNKKDSLNPTMNVEHVGLIAEDVQKVDQRLVGIGLDGKVIGVRYSEMTAVLIKAIQELNLELENQREEIRLLKRKR